MTLEIIGLTKRYKGGVLALDDVSLDLRTGESFGLIGESGSFWPEKVGDQHAEGLSLDDRYAL